jgi:hypothetical protein
MLFNSHGNDRLACAIGALLFAGLSFASALFPVI